MVSIALLIYKVTPSLTVTYSQAMLQTSTQKIYTLELKVYPEPIPHSYLHLLDVHNVHELSLSE